MCVQTEADTGFLFCMSSNNHNSFVHILLQSTLQYQAQSRFLKCSKLEKESDPLMLQQVAPGVPSFVEVTMVRTFIGVAHVQIT